MYKLFVLYAYISNTWNIESKCSSIPLTKGKDVRRALLVLQTEFHMMAIVSSDSSRLMPIHRTYDQMPWADSWAIGLLSESRLVEAALQRQCSLACKHSPWATVKSLVNMTFTPRNWITISALTKIWEWIRPWYTHRQHLIFVWNGFKPFLKFLPWKCFSNLLKS